MVIDESQGASRRWVKILVTWLAVIASVATVGSFLIDIDDIWKSPTDDGEHGNPSASALAANGDERFIQPGQCATNAGTDDTMVLKIADCKSGTIQVIARIERRIGSEDEADDLCRKEAPDYVDYHYSNWEEKPEFVNVVFCLRPFA